MFDRRLNFVFLLFFAFGALIIWRLFGLQVLESEAFMSPAGGRSGQETPHLSERGEIFIQDKEGNLQPVAINKKIDIVYANPRRIAESKKKRVAQTLAEILDSSKENIEKKLSKPSQYQVIDRGISSEEVAEIRRVDISGLRLGKETIRFYPQRELTAHVTGFLGYEGDQRKGQYGVEAYYDRFLRSPPKSNNEASNNLVLSLDYNIQFKAREVLRRAVNKYDAEGGSVVVMNPDSGALLALATSPSYDPNHYSEVGDYNLFLNPVVSKLFEPGSVFKPITMAGGLQEGVISPTTTYYDKGYVKVGGETIRNAKRKAYQEASMIEVLAQSINTGAVFVQQKLGQDKFREYVRKFGMGTKTGIDMPYEVKGDIFNLYAQWPVNFATASFGQGISLTPIEILSAFAAIANGGKLVTPHVADQGKTNLAPRYRIDDTSSRVISPKTASRLTSMLVEVIEEGHGHRTKLDSHYIAGKTGTAQVPKEQAPGYSEKTIHTFIGYAPAYNPGFVILVKLNNPQALRFSAGTAVPVFKEIARYILNYYEIPPTLGRGTRTGS